MIDRRVLACFIALGSIVSAAMPARAATGGPDGAGYFFQDSAESGGPAYSWDEIGSTGTQVPGAIGDDTTSSAVALPFTFTYYGTTYSQVYVCTNGFITLLPAQGCPYSSSALPNTGSPNGMIGAFWADLYTGAGTVRSETLGTAPNRRFVIAFNNAWHYGCGGCTFTLEFKLFETTNVIEIHYNNAPSYGRFHSSGIESATGEDGLSYFADGSGRSAVAVRYDISDVLPPGRPTVTGPTNFDVDTEQTFSAIAADPGGLDIAYLFTWGDGSPVTRAPTSGFVVSGTAQDATHTYTAEGSRTVSVRAVNTEGFNGPAGLLNVSPIVPRPSLPSVTGPGEIEIGNDATFAAVSSDPRGRQIAYTFNWNDGSPAERVPASGFVASGTEQEATHTFNYEGYRYVYVTATNEAGYTSFTGYTSIYVSVPRPTTPEIDGPDTANIFEQAEFSAVSDDPHDRPVAYTFAWSDGSPSERVPETGFVDPNVPQTVSHAFSTEGYGYIYVTATNDTGYTSYQAYGYILIVVPPPGDPLVGGPANPVIDTDASYTFTSTDPSGLPVSYKIKWGDGTTQTFPASGFVPSGATQTVTHTYSERGPKTIKATATNDHGKVSEPTLYQINVSSIPPATPAAPVGPPIATTLLAAEFRASTSDPEGDRISYEFDWDDGTTSRAPTVGYVDSGDSASARHQYAASGTYQVRVRAIDATGAASDYSPASTLEVIV